MDHRAELVAVIRGIRNRWRLRLATRGAVVVFVGMAIVLLLSASSLEAARFSAPAIIGFRFLALAYIRSGRSALLIVSRSAEAASPYKIEVTPGNTSVPRGGDQSVRAKLKGFASKDVTLLMKSAGAAEYERLPLVASAEADTFEGRMFRLDKDTEYYVDSNGVTSLHYKLKVVDLPTVKQLDLEYHFPAYTNLPPRKEESGGDVAALRGTTVLLHITPTMKTSGGQILFKEGGAAAPLSVQTDGTLAGSFTLSQPG